MSCCPCPICFETIESNVNCMVTECGHQFHTNCMLKNVSMGNNGCPLCRCVMVVPSKNDDDDEHDDDNEEYDDDEETILSDETDPFFTDPDIRNNPGEIDDYLLRGFRWLFLQYPSNEDDFSMFDGNSMAITPISVNRVSSSSSQATSESTIDEKDEEASEKEWETIIKEEEDTCAEISVLENTLKKRNISYNDLLTSYLCMCHSSKFYYNEMMYKMGETTNRIDKELNDLNQLNKNHDTENIGRTTTTEERI